MFPFRLLLPSATILLTACFKQMANQPRYEPQGQSQFFADRRVERDQVAGTVASDASWGEFDLHLKVNASDLGRGQQRFVIYCAPCHDRTGQGQGTVVLRGFKRPEPLDSQKNRQLSDQDILNVVTNGYKSMAGYQTLIPSRDRKLISAYVRVLQLQRHVPAADLSDQDRQALEASK